MLEDFIMEAVNDDDDEAKAKIKSQIIKIVSGEKFSKALEQSILETVGNMDFEDMLYDIINEQDMFKPIILAIKKRLQQSLL